MSHTSTLRVLVDQALEEQKATLETFIAEGTADGSPLHQVHDSLVEETGIPVPLRTFYRWAKELQVAS